GGVRRTDTVCGGQGVMRGGQIPSVVDKDGVRRTDEVCGGQGWCEKDRYSLWWTE
ncbi:hypothetical protein NDU88_000251, partial [Pleurodeles waltl]